MPEGDKLFTSKDGTPYVFYLCPPLSTNETFNILIRDHGGEITNNPNADKCVIIAVPDHIPESLKYHRVYSWRVIENSIACGYQLEYSNYLIRQNSHKRHADGTSMNGEEEEGDPREPIVPYSDNNSSPTSNNNHTRNNHNLALVPTNNEESLVVHSNIIRKHGMKYFTSEEDATLLEEIRKRPWLGYRGHQIYKEISQLDFFKERGRTAASLRERIRTLKYNVGYVYKVDSNHHLLVDENGNYVRTYLLQNRVNPFTAADDFGLCKVVYERLHPKENDSGFETILFPTNFFDKYSGIFPHHTAESWRQRFKNYLAIFGVANYLKYFIVQRKQGRQPLPSNLANRDWIKARRSLRKTDGPRLYFPNIPIENEFIDENIDTIEVPEIDGKNLETLTPMSWNDNRSSRPRSQQPAPKRQRTNNSSATPAPVTSTESLKDTTHRALTNPESISQFIDVPTTNFKEKTFVRSYRKYGEPMNIKLALENKRLFYVKLDQAFSHESLSPKQLSGQLRKLGIKEYYTVFLMHRCNSNRKLVEESIKHYVETNGHELLCLEPGAWSNKSLDWLNLRNQHLSDLLKKYHGEENFESQIEALRRTGCINW